jgi:quinoprotein glucose dehydrogenase
MSLNKTVLRITCAFIVFGFLVGSFSCNTGSSSSYDYTTWAHYGGGPDQSKYFDASQITKENVSQMKVTWTYPTNDSISYSFSPIVADTIMYLMGKNYSLIAVNVITGKEIWIHANLPGLTRRGINYWESKDKKDKRLIFTLGNSLQAINALTGHSILNFGDSGYVDMRQGLNRDPSSIRRIQSQLPGVIFENLVIIGSSPGENYFSPPGFVRAYNVVTGKLEWTFHTIPQPGEFGYDSWPKDAYKYAGGVNVWGEISVDPTKGIAYLPLGSPTYDYYGADREGNNLFGNCLVAVDARTGKHLWHFQTVHHDLWDYDLTPAPQLITINREGKSIDAVAIATKHGFMFVFDRVTGEPVFPIEEKPFPASEMPGEKTSPTQPIPTRVPSFSSHEVTKESLNPYFPDSTKQKWHKRLDSAKSGLFIPPSDKYETIMIPGAVGGANFGNTASNPGKGIVYVLTQEYASVYKLSKTKPPGANLSENDVKKVNALYVSSCQSCHGVNMTGGAGPALVNAGQRIFFDEFKNIITNGKGQMPGFNHIDEATLTALYRYLGGNFNRFNLLRRPDTTKRPEGPVVASGGVKMKPDAKRNAPMLEYPEGVAHPEDRYTSGYGLEEGGLSSAPWASIFAYDLNNGTIKWRKPIGEDSLYAKGDKSLGAPIGSQRKGMVVTSTGIVFATGKGGKLYAFDEDNGAILWETSLSHESNALPIMYTVGGKQYLVINATGEFDKYSYNRSTKPGALPKAYVVYALPDGSK